MQQIENFGSMLNLTENVNIGYFCKKIKLPAPRRRPKCDFEKERLQEEKRNLSILFKEKSFHREVDKIFAAYSRSTITNQDRYSSSGVDFYGSGFAEVARDTLELGSY